MPTGPRLPPGCQRTTSSPRSGRRGIRTLIPPVGVRCSRAPRQAVSGCLPYAEVHPGIEPGLPPYQGGVPPATPADLLNRARNSHSVRGHHLTRHQPGPRRPAHRLRPVWLAPSAVRRYSPGPGRPRFLSRLQQRCGMFPQAGSPRPRWPGPAVFASSFSYRHVLTLSSEHPAGVEPAQPAWEAGRLPLSSWVRPVGPEGVEPSPPV